MKAEEAALNLEHWSGLVEQGYEVPAASRYMRISATLLRQQAAEIERLREALRPFAEIANRRGWTKLNDDDEKRDYHILEAPAEDIAPGAVYCLFISSFIDASDAMEASDG